VGVLRGERWLEVFCREHAGGPENGFVPAQLGITGRVVRTHTREVVPNTADDEDFRRALQASSGWEPVYGTEAVRRYRQFLDSVRACVKLPLLRQGRLLGVLCLHRNAAGVFNPHVVQLLDVHADLAGEEVARYLDEEQAVGWRRAGATAEALRL